ncbi:MAG: hypothetical protein FD153_731 [Rhodospirillaceae bacterium]|nr:MAG: hypothetical protein FD153_731 [Rhodospirillaceae bacterium]
MTVSSLQSLPVSYIGDGRQTDFAYNFLTYDPEHLKVVETDPSGREIVLELNENYTERWLRLFGQFGG